MIPRVLPLAIALCAALFGREAHAEHVETLTLPTALAMAKTRSADVRAAVARSQAAEAEADASIAGYLPSLSGEAGAGHTLARSEQRLPGLPDRRAVTAQQRAEASAGVRWTAFDFGQTPNLVGAARANERAARYRSLATYNDTARQVAIAYLEVVYDELLVGNARTSVQIRDRHAAIVRGQVTAGMRTAVDEARARVEVEVARLEQTTSVRQSAQDKARLATLLLLPVTTAFKLVAPVVPGILDREDHLARAAAAQRPEVRASANDVVARADLLSANKLARLPSVGASLDVRERHFFGDTLLPPSERSLSAFVTVNVPIFDWQVWSRIPVAEGNLSAAEAERAGVVAQVQGEAAIAAHGLQAAKALLEQSKSIRELAGATLAVLEARFQSGLATPTDLFDAAAREAEARRSMIRAELGVAVATVEALAATGRMSELER